MPIFRCLALALFIASGLCQNYSNSSSPAVAFTTSNTTDKSTSEGTPVPIGTFILQGLGNSAPPSSRVSKTGIPASTTHPGTALSATFAANTTKATSPTATDNGWASVQSCNSASVSWRVAHAFSGTNTISTSTWVTTIINETTIKPTNSTPITLCDGYPRIEGSLASYANTHVITSSTQIYGSASAVCRTDCPDCTIASEACSKIWSSWDAYTSSNTSDISRFWSTPACLSPTPTAPTYNSYCHAGNVPCTFSAGPVRLAYFPVEVKGNRLCGNYTTVTPTNNVSTPVTVEAYGTTFTSGTAYISFQSLAAHDRCGNPTGSVMSNFFLPLPSADVSSMCGSDPVLFSEGPTSTSLNFADLNYPIATDVYKCQGRCIWGIDVDNLWQLHCQTIYDDYKPVLAYPTQVKQLQPEWNKCWFNPNVYLRYQQQEEYYLFDPPIALTQATSEVLPTPKPQTAHQTSTSVQQTSVSASFTFATPPHETTFNFPAPDASPPDTESRIPDPRISPQAQPNSAGSSHDTVPETGGQDHGNLPSILYPAASPTPVPAGLSVLTAALSKAIETAAPNNAVPAPSANIVTILPAAADPVALSKSGSNYIIDGQTVGPGGKATAGGKVVSMNANGDGLVLDPSSSTVVLSDGQATLVPITSQDLVTVVHYGSQYIAAGETFTAGQAGTVNGHVVSVLPAGAGVVVNGNTILPSDSNPAVTDWVSNGVAISKVGSEYVLNGQTLTAGATALVDGMAATVLPDGGGLVVGTNTISLPPGVVTTPPPFALGATGLEVARVGSEYVVDGESLDPGQIATISGTKISAMSNGAGLVIGTRTISLAAGAATSLPPAVTTSDITLARSGHMLIVNGDTLGAGQTTVFDGEKASVLPGGSGVVIGSRTVSLADHATTTIHLDAGATEAMATSREVTTTSRGSSASRNVLQSSAQETTSKGGTSPVRVGYQTALLVVFSWIAVGSWY